MINLDRFKDRTPNPIGSLRKSAVMILVQETTEGQFLILEKRALSLRAQPGDISLPGGRIEEGETPETACLRETCEELGLTLADLTIVGPMDYYITHWGAIIHPFVGVTRQTVFSPNPEEVDRLLFVPLDWLLHEEPEVYSLRIRPDVAEDFPYDRIQGGRDYQFAERHVEEYFYHFDGHHIWGTTALILRQFLEILGKDA